MSLDADISEVELLQQLIDIESTSGRELEIGIFLESFLKSLGYTVERIPIGPDSTRHNVYAYLGTNRHNRVCLTSHIDTVPPHVPCRITKDTIYGRGACDDLGPLVAQVYAAEKLREEKHVSESGGDISLLFVVGEEKGGVGMFAANNMGLEWEAVIFGEPTESKLVTGHKGHLVFELVAAGQASHSGYPEKGSSATAAIVEVLADLLRQEWPVSPSLGPSTFHIGKLDGGMSFNIIAQDCSAICAVRVSTDLRGIKSKVLDTVAKHDKIHITFKIEYPEVNMDYDVQGFATHAVSYGTDVPRLAGNHKRYLYGPGSILHAHRPDEQISIADLVNSITAYRDLAFHCLMQSKVQ